MTEPLEARLREALRPVPPSDGFTDAVIARLQPRIARRRIGPAAWWVSASLAASLVIAVGVHHRAERKELESGMRARRELIEALRMTNDKLDLVLEVVRDES